MSLNIKYTCRYFAQSGRTHVHSVMVVYLIQCQMGALVKFKR